MANRTPHSGGSILKPLRFVNNTGVALTGPVYLAFTGFDATANQVTVALAQANGANRRADIYLPSGFTVANGGVGFGYRHYIEEGVTGFVLNTAAAAAEAPVYLHPTVAGSWQLTTAPSTAGQDIQEVGVVLTSHATAGRIMVNLMAGAVLGFGPNSISSILLADKPHRDIGQRGTGWIRQTGVAVDGERVTINGRIYEFDDGGGIAVGADVAVDTPDPTVSAANAITALVAAINGDASRDVDAVAGADNTMLILRSRTDGTAGNFTLVENGGNTTISAATLTGGRAAGVITRLTSTYTLTAPDVTLLAATLGTSQLPLGIFPSTTQPTVINVAAQDTNGVVKSLVDARIDVTQVNATQWAVAYREPAGGALLAATDVLSFDVLTT